MPRQSNNRVAWTYTDDSGTDWAISAKGNMVLDVTDGPKLGGEAAAESLQNIPGNMRPRRVACSDASGNIRYVVAYETTAAIWTTPGTTVTLNYFGADVVFTATKLHLGEKANRRGTYQSA